MQISLAFSPCPNDTFIFDALVNNKIDTKGFTFNVFLEDVQTLNQWAINEKHQVTKISYGVLPLVQKNYHLLQSGGALGKGVGPLLITSKNHNFTYLEEIKNFMASATVAIPGINTTAHFLFNRAFKTVKEKQFLVFNAIEDAVLTQKVDAGVIIHENRFTYQQKGLFKLLDLGEFWEQETGLPIPLGGIIAHKSLPEKTVTAIDELIQQSVQYAFEHYPALPPFVTANAQEMSEEVMRQHINLYVNQYSVQLGKEGLQAVEHLMKES